MKKIANIVKVIMVVLCVYVTMACSGCNGKDEVDTDRYTYREFDLQNGSEHIYDTFLRDNNFYYLSCMIYEYDEEDYETQPPEKDNMKLHLYNIDSGEDTVLCDLKDEKGILEDMEIGFQRDFYMTDQNQIKMVYRSDIGEGSEIHTEINIVTATVDGNIVSIVPIADKIAAVWGGECDVDAQNDIRFGQDGQLYFTCKDVKDSIYIVRCDTEGNVTGSIPYDKYVDGLFTDNENKMAVIVHDSHGVEYTFLDFEKGECGETYSIQDEEDVYKFGGSEHGNVALSKIFSGCGDVTCYINDSAGLCAYNAKEQSIIPLFGWTDTGIVGGFVENIIAAGDGRMACMTQYQWTESNTMQLRNSGLRQLPQRHQILNNIRTAGGWKI